MATHPRPHPSIAVRITTSSPVFDLAQQTPFTISLALTLDHTHPITFDPCFTTLFDGKLLCADGLIFTNTATGEPVPRNRRNLCYMNSGNDDVMGPSEKTLNTFVTLRPGKEHVLHATLQPILTHAGFHTQGLTAQEIADKQEELPKTWKWLNVEGLRNGQMYRVGVGEHPGVKSWMQGSAKALVEVKRAGLSLALKTEMVPFIEVGSADFAMRRPDTEESLDWFSSLFERR